MLGWALETVILRTAAFAFADPGNVGYNATTTDLNVPVVVNEIVKGGVTIDKHGNLAQGQLQEGDLELLHEGTSIDWNAQVATKAAIIRGGLEYQVISAYNKPRDRWVVACKRKRGL